MVPTSREAQRAELHKTIWRIANDLRGSVDGWDFKAYVLGMLFYRFISENLTAYINRSERAAGHNDFDYATLPDTDINDDVVFEIELIKQVEINVDYILMLVEKYRAERGDGDDKEIRAEITRAVDASPTLRSKRDLVEEFVDRISLGGAVDDEWAAFIAAKREAELMRLISDENLRPDATRAFMDAAFRDGALTTTGTAITTVLPPVSRFTPTGGHGETKQRVIEKLNAFFERFFGLAD